MEGRVERTPQLVKRCLTRAPAESVLERPIPGEGTHSLEGSCPWQLPDVSTAPQERVAAVDCVRGPMESEAGLPLGERAQKAVWLLKPEVSGGHPVKKALCPGEWRALARD